MIGLHFYPLVSADRGWGGGEWGRGGLHDEPKERLRGKAKTVVDSFAYSGVSIVQCQSFVLLVSHAR